MKVAVPVPEIPVESFTLRCGAELFVSRREGAPVCAVQMHLRGGHSLDPPERRGTAFLAGRLLDQGTTRRSEEEFATALETYGGGVTGGSTGLSGSIANDAWKLLLELAAEAITKPAYPRAKIERQRQRLLDRFLVERDDPRVQGGRLFRKLVYGDHWLGEPDHGTLETVANIERRHLAAFHKKNWVASRAVLAFCGDVEPSTVKRFLDKQLASWETGKPLPPPDTTFPPIEPRLAVFPADRQQVHVYLGHLGIRRTDPDYAALLLMDHILGTGPGFTNRISQVLRDQLGLAYTVHAAIHSSAGVLPGLFTAYIGTSPANLKVAIQGLRREIRRIQDEPVMADELELARNYLTGSLVLGFERASRRTQHIVAATRNGLPFDHMHDLVVRLLEVSVEDVQRVARKHLHPERACLVAAGPTSKKELQGLVASR